MDVDKRPGGEPAHGMLADTGEQGIAELVEADHENAADGVGHNQHHRHQKKCRQECRAAAGAGQGIGDPFVSIRHQHGDDLGRHQRQKGNQDALLQIRPVSRPHIGPQIGDGLKRPTAIGGDLRRFGGRVGIRFAGWICGRVSARHYWSSRAGRRRAKLRQDSGWFRQAPAYPASSASRFPHASSGSGRRP